MGRAIGRKAAKKSTALCNDRLDTVAGPTAPGPWLRHEALEHPCFLTLCDERDDLFIGAGEVLKMNLLAPRVGSTLKRIR